ncbi:hypothetical protein R1sor_011805 [Riccia sorocarpa]|uniref:Uncharacterized protein n=1 Tax=Riccia sorocarpa TaxID=122646 RepID=A0ABD3I833_9MARC
MSELLESTATNSGSSFLSIYNGIGVGPKDPRQGNINRGVQQYLHNYWKAVIDVQLELEEVPTRVTLLKSTMVKATLYGPGDYAFVKSDSSDRMEGSWHWKTKISRIFAHSCRGHSTMFGEGGVGHPPPQPEVDDVMLAAHRPNCSTKFLKHCVVTEVQNNVAGSVLDEEDEDATERMETSLIVKVLWLRRTVPGQWEINGGRRCCRTMQVAQL